MYELLKEQTFLEAKSTRTGGERGQGSYLKHRLVPDTEIVFKPVLRGGQFENWYDIFSSERQEFF